MNVQFTSSVITGAGLAVGIALLAVEAWRWWKTGGGAPAAPGGKGAAKGGGGGGRDPKALVPFGGGLAVGTIMVACPAGLLGTAAGVLRWGGNGVGDFLMSTLTGQRSTTIATGSAPALDGNGALIVTALVIALFLLRKSFAKVAKGRFWRGVFAGTLLCIGTGMFAVVSEMVIPSVNGLGAQLLGAVVNGTLA